MFFIFQKVIKKYGRTILFPGIVGIILLYLFLQQEDSSKESYTISTISQDQIEQLNQKEQQQTGGKAKEKQVAEAEPKTEPIFVDVKGAVKYPGVYKLTSEDRVIDAIDTAGGYTEEAETKAINHAQKLQDEMVIYVPKIGEVIENSFSSGTATSVPQNSGNTTDKVNINSADEATLTTLPGIGPSKAQAIISYREENGPFQSIDELKNVSGIGDKTFEKLMDLIDVK
ncbi:ComEA family DNA-binding protein [Ureibacillus galli]|uniref:ComEA family DNA-binding protein n=1 Tax=Ureibacillus galli TaxID=2762222 RepID=UPI00296B0647|nr:ComEA family DNA-binding protein [Ureibacillus galli]